MTVQDDIQRQRILLAVLNTAIEDGSQEFAAGRDWFTANELGEHLGVSPQVANNRLQRLLSNNLVERERMDFPGRQYRYRAKHGLRYPGTAIGDEE